MKYDSLDTDMLTEVYWAWEAESSVQALTDRMKEDVMSHLKAKESQIIDHILESGESLESLKYYINNNFLEEFVQKFVTYINENYKWLDEVDLNQIPDDLSLYKTYFIYRCMSVLEKYESKDYIIEVLSNIILNIDIYGAFNFEEKKFLAIFSAYVWEHQISLEQCLHITKEYWVDIDILWAIINLLEIDWAWYDMLIDTPNWKLTIEDILEKYYEWYMDWNISYRFWNNIFWYYWIYCENVWCIEEAKDLYWQGMDQLDAVSFDKYIELMFSEWNFDVAKDILYELYSIDKSWKYLSLLIYVLEKTEDFDSLVSILEDSLDFAINEEWFEASFLNMAFIKLLNIYNIYWKEKYRKSLLNFYKKLNSIWIYMENRESIYGVLQKEIQIFEQYKQAWDIKKCLQLSYKLGFEYSLAEYIREFLVVLYDNLEKGNLDLLSDLSVELLQQINDDEWEDKIKLVFTEKLNTKEANVYHLFKVLEDQIIQIFNSYQTTDVLVMRYVSSLNKFFGDYYYAYYFDKGLSMVHWTPDTDKTKTFIVDDSKGFH